MVMRKKNKLGSLTVVGDSPVFEIQYQELGQ